MRVTAIRRKVGEPKPPFVERIAGPEQLDDALRGCDVLVISAPSIAETDRLIGAERLALLNRGAVVINVARGKIIDEPRLLGLFKADTWAAPCSMCSSMSPSTCRVLCGLYRM